MKVDIHTHILPRKIPRFMERFAYGGFIQLEPSGPCSARMVRDDGTFFREIQSNCWDPDIRVKDCDSHGVHIQVLSTVPVMFSYWAKPEHGAEISRFLNDDLAESVAKHPKRFIGLGTVPMQDPELACRELERCVRELGFAGVQIGSHVEKPDLSNPSPKPGAPTTNLGDPSLVPFWALAETLGASVFVHPWDMMGQERMTQYWLPWLVGMPAEVSLAMCSMLMSGTLLKHPKLRIAFAHGGGAFPGTIGRIEHGYHARPDLCAMNSKVSPRKQLGSFWVDSLTHDLPTLLQILPLFGESKVALGSDYPFPLGEDRPGTLIEEASQLSVETKRKLLSQNALEWLGRS